MGTLLLTNLFQDLPGYIDLISIPQVPGLSAPTSLCLSTHNTRIDRDSVILALCVLGIQRHSEGQEIAIVIVVHLNDHSVEMNLCTVNPSKYPQLEMRI